MVPCSYHQPPVPYPSACDPSAGKTQAFRDLPWYKSCCRCHYKHVPAPTLLQSKHPGDDTLKRHNNCIFGVEGSHPSGTQALDQTWPCGDLKRCEANAVYIQRELFRLCLCCALPTSHFRMQRQALSHACRPTHI